MKVTARQQTTDIFSEYLDGCRSPQDLSRKIITSIICICFILTAAVATGKPLPAENACITANIPDIPKLWQVVTWEAVGNDIYIFAQTPLKDDKDTPLTFKFKLNISPKNDYKLVEPKVLPVDCEFSASDLDANSRKLLSPYEVMKDENPLSGNIYIVVLTAKIKRMAFTDAVILKSDDNQTTYSAANDHWIDDDLNGTPDENQAATHPPDKVKSYPCSYKRDVEVQIKAKFKVANSNLKKIWIRGKSGSADSPLVFEKKMVDVSGGEAVYDRTSTGGKLVNKVRGYMTENRGKPWNINDPLVLTWEYSLDGGDGNWSDAGASKHTVYVTLETPDSKLLNRQETVFNLSCRNGNNEDTHEKVFAAVWNDIKDLEVKRMDGKVMRYWNPIQSVTCNTMSGMLAQPDGNGTCGSWAELLLKTMKAHDDPNITLIAMVPDKTKSPEASFFMTKGWKFSKSIWSGTDNIANSTFTDDDIQNIATGDKTNESVVRTGLFTHPSGTTIRLHLDEDGLPVDPITNISASGKPAKYDLVYRELPYIFPGHDLDVDSTVVPDDSLKDGDSGNPSWPYSPQTFRMETVTIGGTDIGTARPISSPKAQNNSLRTPNAFRNHAIVKYKSEFFDPSYGEGGFATQLLYEQKMIEGLIAELPDRNYVLQYLLRKKGAAEEMKFDDETSFIMSFQ